MTNPFDRYEQQDVLRVTLHDGTILTGAYLTAARMHFVHQDDGTPLGKVSDDIAPEEMRT